MKPVDTRSKPVDGTGRGFLHRAKRKPADFFEGCASHTHAICTCTSVKFYRFIFSIYIFNKNNNLDEKKPVEKFIYSFSTGIA